MLVHDTEPNYFSDELPHFAQFLTLTTYERQPIFGVIQLQQRHKIWCPSDWGQAAEQTLGELLYQPGNAILEDFVVMPNHIHLLVLFHHCNRRACHHFVTTCKQTLVKAMRQVAPTPEPVWETSFAQQTIQSIQAHYALSQSLRHHHDHWRYDSLYKPSAPPAQVAETPKPQQTYKKGR